MPSFDLIPCPALVTDGRGVVQSLNQDLLLLIGSNKERWLFNSMEAMFPMASRIFLQTHIWPMILRDGRIREIRLQLIDACGNSLPVFVNCQMTTREGIDQFTWIFFVSVERSRFEQELLQARRRAELAATALANSEEFLRRVFEAAIEGIVVTDSIGTVLSINPAFSKLTGYSEEEMIGRNASFLKSSRNDAEFFRAMTQTLKADKVWKGEVG